MKIYAKYTNICPWRSMNDSNEECSNSVVKWFYYKVGLGSSAISGYHVFGSCAKHAKYYSDCEEYSSSQEALQIAEIAQLLES